MIRSPLRRTAPDAPAYAAVKVPRARKCRICFTRFTPAKDHIKFCGPECGYLLSQQEVAKAERKTTRTRLIELKPLKWWRAKAKTALHALVRARDEGKQCASCDTLLLKLGRAGGDYDAGHFRPVGLARHLEFDRRNIWGQCKYCNDHLRGNFQAYEQRLRAKHGDSFVDELLADNEPRHLKIHDFQQIEAQCKAELKALTNSGKCP